MNSRFKYLLHKVRSDLLHRGVNPGFVCPPLMRLLWMLGFPLKPPICMGLVAIFIYNYIGPLVIMLIFTAFTGQLVPAIFFLPLAGIFFAVYLTMLVFRERRRVNPPSWDYYENVWGDD